ncbi:DUF1294 domain-containing protein [Peribacillus alkalitolerans]|uniref:DUF1294 domain-containing protein n=1 Tax=Peribacillus alkalitolerans TaxID=1550385 RepID=UPI0013D3DC0C|nr:DUF1294 domain-containing protein [Peribacillus alkalitolerans]
MGLLELYFIVINIVGIVIMFSDKQKAKRGQYRTPERTIWIIALLGGAVGATVGMNWFRHKTKHTSFKIGLPVLSLLHIILYLLLLSKL